MSTKTKPKNDDKPMSTGGRTKRRRRRLETNQPTPTMPHSPKPETNEVQTDEAVDPAANCSALRVAELVDQARLALADALTIIEAKRTYSGKKWTPKMRTRAEGEGKYGLRNALVELKSKAQWLAEDARKPNGGWPWPNAE